MPKQRKSARVIRFQRFKSDDQRKAMFANLINKHQGLVHKEAYRFAGRMGAHGQNLRDDFVAAGNEGLIQYAKRYNPKRGAFTTGATQAIRARIIKESQASHVVRVPEKKIKAVASRGPLPTSHPLSDLREQGIMGGIDKADARLQAQSMLKGLPLRERRIVQMRFFQDKSLAQVGKKFRITPNQVRKIEQRTFQKLRQSYKD